jgi:predicted porin
MKKSLIALAALSAIAGSAVAQSSVTVYGVLDAGFGDISREVTDGNNAGAAGNREKDQQKAFGFNQFTSSRLGFRGTEDLGGGMKASFVVETGISSNPMAGYSQTALNRNAIERGDRGTGVAANGTTIDATSIGNRELNASLALSAGTTLTAGFGGTAIRANVLAFDAAYGANLVGNVLTNDALLSSNRATYAGVSQNLGGGLTAGVAMTQNNKNTNTDSSATTTADIKTNSGMTLNLGYAQGKLAAGYARQSNKTSTNAGSAVIAITSSSTDGCSQGGAGTFANIGSTTAAGGTATQLYSCTTPAALATEVKRTIDIAGGSYDFGVAKVFAQYGKVKTDDAKQVNATGEGERKAYTLGAQVPLGKVTAFGVISKGEVTEVSTGATASGAGTAAVQRDHSGYVVGAKYDFSKRTFAYGAIGETKLDAATTGGDYNYGVKVKQMAIGLGHSF